jgi:heme exporter protein D
MGIFIIIFIIVVFWACVRSIGGSRRYRREYRERREDRRLAEFERRAALAPGERDRETQRDDLVVLLKGAYFVAFAIAVFGQSVPYFWIAVGLAIFAVSIEASEKARRARLRGKQRRDRDLLVQRALERATGER